MDYGHQADDMWVEVHVQADKDVCHSCVKMRLKEIAAVISTPEQTNENSKS